MRLHRRTLEKVGVYLIRYCRYVHRVITELHSIVHGIRRVRSTSTMIFLVPASLSLFSVVSWPFDVANTISSSGIHTSNSRRHNSGSVYSAYSLGCSFLGKKYYRWSSLLSRDNGPRLPSVLSLFYYAYDICLAHIDINRISY